MIDAAQLKFQTPSRFAADGAHIPARFIPLGEMTVNERAVCLAWCESIMAEPWYSKADHSLQLGLWTEKIAAAAEWIKAQP